MDECRKTKRRIIDSTSVPTSRRTSYRQLDKNSYNNKIKEPLEDIPKYSQGPDVSVNGVRSETDAVINEDVRERCTKFNEYCVTTGQKTPMITLADIQACRMGLNPTNNGNCIKANTPNAKPQQLRSDAQTNIDIVEQTTQNSHFSCEAKLLQNGNHAGVMCHTKSDEVHKGCIDETSKPIVTRTILADILEKRTHHTTVSDLILGRPLIETEEGNDRMDDLHDDKINSMVTPIHNQHENVCKRKDSGGPMYSTSKAVRSSVRFSLTDSIINASVEDRFKTPEDIDTKVDKPYSDVMNNNPLIFNWDADEEDDIGSVVFSDMFETKNVCIEEVSEKISSEQIHCKENINNVNIKFHEFFGDDDELSSIVDRRSDSPYMYESVIKCGHGLSLFDDLKTVHASSKLFKVSVSETNEMPASLDDMETKGSHNMDLGLAFPSYYNGSKGPRSLSEDCFDVDDLNDDVNVVSLGDDDENDEKDVCSSLMDEQNGAPRVLSVEEKWQIIFNERTRAPIYAVTHYTGYLNQFVNGHNAASRDSNVIKKDGINPISYLLRKLKLDLKMSYESFVEEFTKPSNNGLGLLIKLLKSIQNTGSQQSGSTNLAQLKHYKKTLTDEHDCLLCIKYSLRLKSSLKALFDINYGLETVSMAVISTFTKSRGTAIEILTICLSTEEGFSRILDCFTYLQLKIGEPVRFKSLVNMMNMDSRHNTLFKVSTMKFMNTLLDASSNTNIRVFLQHELETAGLDIDYMLQKATGTGLEFDDLRRELSEWQRKYVNVDTILSERGTIAHRTLDPGNQKMIEELQTQVKKLSADKAYLEYQLSAVSTELRSRYEELQKRTPLQQHASTQCDIDTECTQCVKTKSDKKSIGCQSYLPLHTAVTSDHLKHATDYFEWKDVYINENQDVYYPVYQQCSSEPVDEMTTSDEEGVVKVQHWLRSHCESSENVNKLKSCATTDPSSSECPTFYFKRDSLTRRSVSVRKTEFPGNWKLIPKSFENFPSRFPVHQCHKTNCDRCDLRNRPENSGQKNDRKSSDTPIQNFALEVRLNDLVKNKKRSEVRSQSSDSAIGGSGEERTWNDRRIPLVPAKTTEAEILQDLIQPDDSASACPESEPYPDYSSVDSRFGTQNSLRTQLSQVLREFEGDLLQYESPSKPKTEPVEHFICLGDI
ncbi:uncharacterized protein LOC132723600 [Ruditapes philippinarum]|uniref:uncharacterized protein LOC132723600 n=1 Tax=Ruditapes philippinarum TaxID=129788 RepID=UPI00295A8DBC|nr:uncharacterized protein LOC132723600 [Ruditapes philippinarum]